ncbi:phage tail protein, partial [Ralstonia solanacearum]
TGARSLSFEYQYTLTLIVTDYPDSSDTIVVPVLAWLRT